MKTKIFIIIKAILGIVWVATFAVIGVMMFMNIDSWAQKLLTENNVTVHSKYTGGDTNFEKSGDDYTLIVHKPVMDGVFFKSKKESYIQIDWLSKTSLPEKINERIDFNNDGTTDINVIIDTKKENVVYKKYNNSIFGLLNKTSLADFHFRKSKKGKDALFKYKNRKYNDYVYSMGVSIRLIIKEDMSIIKLITN